ncbi:MAG: tryptophan-rich sensory protein [Lachnospiraceae bacterium]|nr:tryptophan-rich sensory protein [Lachnospiraceae bacterium]
MRTDTKRLIGCVAIPLLVGDLAAFLTMEGMEYYKEEVTKPALTPPPWVFSVVWTILYVVMGYASFLVNEEGTGDQKTARFLYFAQLFFNFCWPIVFFNFRWYLFAFAWLLCLWFLVLATIRAFGDISPKAGKLLIPYLLWLTFAAYLNFGVYLLN